MDRIKVFRGGRRGMWVAVALLVSACSRLEEQLLTSDSVGRLAAVHALGKLKTPERLPLIDKLVPALGSIKPNERERAAEALALLGPQSIRPLEKALKDPNAGARAGAAEALGMIGPPAREILSSLLRAKDDPDKEVQMWAILALIKIDPGLVEVEKSMKEGIPAPAASQPAGPKRPDVFSQHDLGRLIRYLGDEDPLVRADAALALLEKKTVAVSALVQALEDPSEHVRIGAAQVLRQLTLSPDAVIRDVVKLLKDIHTETRQASFQAFRGIPVGEADALPRLVALLQAPQLCVRLEAILFLGDLGAVAAPAVPALKRLLFDPNPFVQESAVAALHKVGYRPAFDAGRLENDLNMVWRKMLLSLTKSDIPAALGHFAPERRDRYETSFRSIHSDLPHLAKRLTVQLKLNETYGQRFATLSGPAVIDGFEQDLRVQFIKDADGAWRILLF